MKQVLIIDGGTSYNSYESYLKDLKNKPLSYERMKKDTIWHSWLADQLTEVDVLRPSFPNSSNAVFDEWKIVFEKVLPFLDNNVTIIGHSLGAMFLAIYLHEHPLQNPIHQLILISPAYNDDTNEELGSFEVKYATGLERSAREIHLFHSEDDPLVPFSELSKFQKDIPSAISHVFTDRGHFIQSTFPELLELLKQK